MKKALLIAVTLLALAAPALSYDGGGICDWMPKDSDMQKYDGGGIGD